VRLPVKLSLLLAAATTIPLMLTTTVLLPRGARALHERMDALYAQDARGLALECQRTLIDQLEALSLAARTLRLGELDAATREQALLLLYKETRGANVMGLYDEHGKPVAPEVRFENLDAEVAGQHEPVSDVGLLVFSHHVPLDAALETGLAIGPAYVSVADDPQPRVVLAARIAEKRWVLAMEMSLQPLNKMLTEFRAGETGSAFLIDSRGRVIVHRDRELMRNRADLSLHPLVTGRESPDLLGASADVPVLGWKVVVQEPASDGLRPIHRLRSQVLVWTGLGLALALGAALLFVRKITRPLAQLRRAALAVTGGALDTTVAVSGKDEVADLATAFNSMTRGLREREQMKLTLSLSSTLDLQEVLHRLLDSVANVVRFSRAAVLVNRSDRFLVDLARGYVDPETPGHDDLIDRAVKDRLPVLSEGRRQLAIPLISHGEEVAGVMRFEHSTPYTDEEVAVAAAFVRPATVAVDNARLFAEVKRLATFDVLTGIPNRRHFVQVGERLFETAKRYGQPVAALMLDVDHFKAVNDRYGHSVGDEVLREVAQRCLLCLRTSDLLGRYGGEEFAFLLPMIPESAAESTLAERIRRSVCDEPMITSAGAVNVTVSIGVAALDPSISSLEMLLKIADERMYFAKKAGRDRVA
jgi:diguanylate cyclase (GGDEF)-like protein